jgi:streptogramin lyase
VPPKPKVDGAVWVDGEWTERRGRWAWKLGRWVLPPPGARFSPWVFVRGDDGSAYFAPGVFRDAKGEPVAEPTALEVAKADAVAVVDAEGVTVITGRTVHAHEAK